MIFLFYSNLHNDILWKKDQESKQKTYLKKAINSFNQLHNKEITIKGKIIKINKYLKHIINRNLKNKLTCFLQPVLQYLNKFTKQTYNIISIDSVIEKISNTGEKIYLIDFFVTRNCKTNNCNLVISFSASVKSDIASANISLYCSLSI